MTKKAMPWLGLLLACAVRKPAVWREPECPAWTRHERPAEYPADRYIVGIGAVSGIWDATRGDEPAKTAAVADIAKQLRSSVDAQIHVSEKETSGVGSLVKVEEATTLRSTLSIEGARVVARCFSPSATTAYALAVVDREEMAHRLQQGIEDANRRGTQEVASARELLGQGRTFEALSHGRAALRATGEAEESSRLFMAVAGRIAASPFQSTAAAQTFLGQIREQARVRVTVAGSSRDLHDALVRAVTESGALVAGNDDSAVSAVLILRGSVDVQPATRVFHGGMVAKARAVVELVRTDTGSVVGAAERADSGGGRTEQDAAQRVSSTVAAAIGAEAKRLIAEAMGDVAVPPPPPQRDRPPYFGQ